MADMFFSPQRNLQCFESSMLTSFFERVPAGHILHDRRNAASPTSLKHTYHALFSPRRSELALQLLSSLSTPSILSDLNLYDLGLELVPLEQDVLSLEEPSCWADVWARGDHGVIHRAVMSLMTVQHIYGAFPHIVGKGDMAQRLCSLLLRQRREYLSSDPTNPMLQSPSTQIDSLIIIDRSVDLASPLCTQLTYEGLIDEVVGIRSAHVEIDQSFVAEGRPESNVATPSGSTTPLQLSSRKTKKVRLDRVTDPLFGSVRDENFAIVGERLHTSAKQLNEDYEKRHNARTVAEMRAFVSQLGGLTKAHTSLRLHTGLTEKIMEYTTRDTFNTSLELQQNIVAGFDLAEQLASIEDLLLSEAPLSTVLRLLCLLSVVGGGIKPKSLEYLKREIVQTYGYQYLPLLNMLARTELLTRATPSSARSTVGFQAARGPLRLVVDDVDERDPNDISYVYSGYAPLSIRLVQAVAQKDALLARSTGGAVRAPSQRAGVLPRAHAILGWRGFEDVVKCVPGAMFEETQHRFEGHEGVRTSLGRSNGVASGRNGHSKQDLQQDTATSWMPSLGSSGDATGPKAVSAASVQAAALPASSATATTTTTMVFFLGGVTYAEISALRFMSQQTRNRRFVVATTNIISGDVMIETLQHPQSQ